jgi:hypothetical protein
MLWSDMPVSSVFPKKWDEITPCIKLLAIVTCSLVFLYVVRDILGALEQSLDCARQQLSYVCDKIIVFDETKLPPIEDFYSKLSNSDIIATRLQSPFHILVTRALLAKFSEWNSSKPRLVRTFRLVRRV